tara:strand:+ start:927 stop:3167 length:2241 start_codon:yes stop_codon:yes gene_type:complete
MKKFLVPLILIFLNICTQSNAVIINQLEIKNNNRISKETISTYGKITLGKDYNQDDLNSIIKNLYETNFFKNITLSVDGDKLVLDIEENKIVQKVIIEGIKSSQMKEAILKNLFSKDKSPFLSEKVRNDQVRIKNSLTYLGYYMSNVESRIQENENNTVDLFFKINLGEKSKISKIEFIGEKKIKDRTLRSVIISEEAKFWKFISKNKYVNETTIERDKRLLKNFYLNKGYYNVDIQSATVKFFDDKSFKLTYKIDAGEIFTINETNLKLPIDYDEKNFEDVNKELDKLVGKKYSLFKINSVINEIDKISLSRQFDFINADLIETIIDDNKINLSFNISESEKFYIERINVFGNNITYESVIRNKLEIDEGDPFNELLNARSLNNLKASNLFKSVKSEVIEGSTKGTKVINVNVEEKPTGEITIGAGAGTEGGTLGFSVSENNFLGKGIKLGTALRLTEDTIKGSFSVTNPNFKYSGKSLSTSFERTDIDKMTDNGYNVSKTGFSFGTGYEQFENVYFTPRISNYYEDLSTSSKASDNLKKQSGDYLESKFFYSLDYDMRDQKYQPSEGFRSIFRQGVPLISDEYSLSNSYDFKQWYKLPNDMVTSFNIYGKTVHSLNGENVRITNRTFLPRNKLKGFNTRNIGPVDSTDYVGGNYAAALNIDTTLPMFFPTLENIDFRYFVDVANLWGVDYSSSVDQSNTVRSSTGFVVDWFTPIGPLNFSLSQNLSKADDDKTESFQFNLGTTF